MDKNIFLAIVIMAGIVILTQITDNPFNISQPTIEDIPIPCSSIENCKSELGYTQEQIEANGVHCIDGICYFKGYVTVEGGK